MQKSNNGKSASISVLALNEIEFQVSPGTDSRVQSKDEVKKICNGLRSQAAKGLQPFILKSGISALIETLNSGHSVHFGITQKSTKSEDVDYFLGCFADYDAFDANGLIANAANLAEILALPTIKAHCHFYQFSSKGNPNSHWFFSYSRKCSYQEHCQILRLLTMKLNNELGNDKKGFDHSIESNSSNLCFAGKDKCVESVCVPVLILVDEWLTEANELAIGQDGSKFGANKTRFKNQDVQQTLDFENPGSALAEPAVGIAVEIVEKSEDIPTDSDSETLTGKVLKHIAKHFKVKESSDFYNLYQHSWKWLGNGRYEGCNPFSSTDKSGTSFTITDNSDDLPPAAYDRASNQPMTLIEYFFRVKKITGEYSTVGLKGKGFKKIVADICEHFEIPQFKFPEASKEEKELSKRQKLFKDFTDAGFTVTQNEMTLKLYLNGKVVNADSIAYILDKKYDVVGSKDAIAEMLYAEGCENSFHPVRDFINECIKKFPVYEPEFLEKLGSKIFASTEHIHDVYVKKMMMSAVARAFVPGIECKQMLVLYGTQNFAKSGFIRALFGEEFTNANFQIATVAERDELIKIRRSWVLEIAELDKIVSKFYRGAFKSLLSDTVDTFRVPYARETQDYPRTSIFIGSTNEREILSDPTGNTRYWVLPVNKLVDYEQIKIDRVKYWAMAYHAWMLEKNFNLTPEEDLLRDASNENYETNDAIADLILAKANYYPEITISELLMGCTIPGIGFSKQDQMRVADILKKAGWEKLPQRKVNGVRKVFWKNPGAITTPETSDEPDFK